jgi:hypothetical protein
MKCSKCGGEVAANLNFCGSCGNPIEHTETVSSESKPFAAKQKFDIGILRKFIKPAIIVVAAIIVLVVAVNALKPSKYQRSSAAIYITQEEDSVVILPNGKNRTLIAGTLVTQYHSADRRTAAVIIDEEQGASRGSQFGYSLYLIKDTPTLVSDSVSSAVISYSGGGLAYIKDVDDGFGSLCLYSGGKNETITSDINNDSDEYVISPDGRVVAYSITDEDGETVGYYYDGKQRELDDGVTPIAVADGAKYVYYNRNDTLYVQRGDNADSRESLGSGAIARAFNKDLSQCLYVRSERAYISRHGAKGTDLAGILRFPQMLLPDGIMRIGNIIGVSSFADTYYQDYDFTDSGYSERVRHINRNFEDDGIIVRNALQTSLASDGKTITYLRNDAVYKIDGSKANAEAVELVEENVTRLFATDKGNAVFFVNEDDEVYFQKGTGKPVQVGDYGSDFSLFNGNTLFYVSDDELYVTSGEKAKRIGSFDGDVLAVTASFFQVRVESSDGAESFTYLSTDGKSFDLVATEEYTEEY